MLLKRHFYIIFSSLVTKIKILMQSYLYLFQYCHVHFHLFGNSVLAIDGMLSQGHFFLSFFFEDYRDTEEQNREIIEKCSECQCKV